MIGSQFLCFVFWFVLLVVLPALLCKAGFVWAWVFQAA
jgi:hypothetical protein